MRTRRGFLAGAGLGVAAGVSWLAGSSSPSRSGQEAATSPSSTAGGAGEPLAAFPVQVKHKFGTTTISTAPSRVVSVGITEQDPLLALGVVPVAVTEWYGKQPFATWPWARDLLGQATPVVLSTSGGFEFEKVASLTPDLIVGTNSGMTKQDYDKFSKIAPTVANSGSFSSDYFEPWTTQTQLIGAALGLSKKTGTLTTALKTRFAEAASEHPQFTGKKIIFLQGGFADGTAIASQAGLGTDFLTDLGFSVPSDIDPYIRGGNQAQIPLEKLSVLDVADVLVWATDDAPAAAERAKNPLYKQLKAVRAGRSIDTGPELAAATYFSSILSLGEVLDQLLPKLEVAVGKP